MHVAGSPLMRLPASPTGRPRRRFGGATRQRIVPGDRAECGVTDNMQEALRLMRLALDLLDEEGEQLAAARLQHAVDTIEEA